MTTPSPEQFSLGDITEVLGEVLTDPMEQEMVVSALRTRAQDREKRLQSELRLDSLARITRGLIRIEGSDSNIEGWYEQLDAESARFLGLIDYYGVKDSLTDVERTGRDVAAVLYTYSAMHPVRRGIEPERLHKAGVDQEALIAKYKAALLEVYPDTEENRIRLDEALSDIEGLYKIASHPNVWKKLITPQRDKLRELLEENGLRLPSLNNHGEFTDEEDE